MPSPSRHPRRDPHDRGPRGPLFFPGTPAWKTRRESFGTLATSLIVDLAKKWPAVYIIEFATEDVPPSDPASQEDHSEVLGRVFHADRRRDLRDRIVVYRLPIALRSHDDVPRTLRKVLMEHTSRVLAIPPDELEEELYQNPERIFWNGRTFALREGTDFALWNVPAFTLGKGARRGSGESPTLPGFLKGHSLRPPEEALQPVQAS